VDAIDRSEDDYDPIVADNKVINNSISDFDNPIEDSGTETKVHANMKPFE